MAALTAQAVRKIATSTHFVYPVASGATIYKGAAVSLDDTMQAVRPLVGASGDVFVGFAIADSVDGKVEVELNGVYELTVNVTSFTSIHRVPVYATTDNDFSTLATGGIRIGAAIKIYGVTTGLQSIIVDTEDRG